jgi:hypothetical protein
VYADEATKFAGRSDEEVLADACRERMNRLTDYLLDFAAEEGRFPPDLPSLEAWVVGRLPVLGLREYPIPPIEMAFRCPSGEGGTPIPFVYSPPADGRQPRTGDVLVRCPKHPECRIVWSERLAKRLRQRG